MKTNMKAFISGFISTLVFHQGIIGLLFLAKVIPFAPYDMTPNSFGVPGIISLAFFGGLWGMLIWHLVKKDQGAKHWAKATIFGAIGPTVVAFLVVFPLKGITVKAAMIPIGLILNGAWGFGNSFFMKLMKENN
ncbi:hypothetical protein [Endozoicomonas lisbonensis]|uniref:Uncharacterized protein n=1 Tax=Endozoicomonas lisbonensis TaxID=3120522 RepID=A0ABV2SN52_9GAMM